MKSSVNPNCLGSGVKLFSNAAVSFKEWKLELKYMGHIIWLDSILSYISSLAVESVSSVDHNATAQNGIWQNYICNWIGIWWTLIFIVQQKYFNIRTEKNLIARSLTSEWPKKHKFNFLGIPQNSGSSENSPMHGSLMGTLLTYGCWVSVMPPIIITSVP